VPRDDDDILRVALELAARERGQTTADVDTIQPHHLAQATAFVQAREAGKRRRMHRALGLLALVGTALCCLFLYELGTPVPVVVRAGFTLPTEPPEKAKLGTTFTRAQAADGLVAVVELENLLSDASFVLDAAWRGPDGKEQAVCSGNRQHVRERRLVLSCRAPLPQPVAVGTWHVQLLVSHPRLYQMEVPLPGSATPGELALTISE
jgi:hypothetical protein